MQPAPIPLDPLTLRHAFARFTTGVTVITTLDAHGAPVGMTANSFGSVSLYPPLVQWSLRANSALHDIFATASEFAVSVLAADQEAIAHRFASRVSNRFEGIEVVTDSDAPPLLRGALAHFVCRTVNVFPVGDHDLFIGEVRRASFGDGHPLIFYGSHFRALA
ncbi:MAG: flavin reductase family protein [Burkholderiales bacterium]|nr:flavin reductase family protein [Burkholderiales bacterium]